MIHVTLFSREDCHLCEQALEDLQALKEELTFELEIFDVDGNADLRRAYGLEVPVVEVGPYKLKAPFTRQELQITLMAALDRQKHIESIEQSEVQGAEGSKGWNRADTFTYWFANHYMAILNLFVLIYVGLPFLAPVLMRAGAQKPANAIYRSYSFVCHQLAYRSFFIFGEQAAYPRAAAGVTDLATFNQATGLSEANTNEALYAARNFVGNPVVGYKIALCERDIAIYGAILAFGLLFALTGRRIPALPWYLWILIGLVPIGLDGFSQLLSQPPFSFWPYRESTPYMRALTGALFGFMTAWFGYPLVEVTMAETRQIMARKWLRVTGGVGSEAGVSFD
jgi:uncharacterized membrane protein